VIIYRKKKQRETNMNEREETNMNEKENTNMNELEETNNTNEKKNKHKWIEMQNLTFKQT